MADPLKAVAQAARKAAYASGERDARIRLAHEQGSSLRAIAKAAGLSFQRIHQIVSTSRR